jgi:hypothetical protein
LTGIPAPKAPSTAAYWVAGEPTPQGAEAAAPLL